MANSAEPLPSYNTNSSDSVILEAGDGTVIDSVTYGSAVPWPLKTAEVFAWRKAHWANWNFALEKYDPVAQTIDFGIGGFQGARGGPGSDWFVSNVFEELDAPTEYYYSVGDRTLYYFANNTEGKPPPTSDGAFVLIPAHRHTLINVTPSISASRNPPPRGSDSLDWAACATEAAPPAAYHYRPIPSPAAGG